MFEEFGVFIYTTREMVCGGHFFGALGFGLWTLGLALGLQASPQAASIALLVATMLPSSSLWSAGRPYRNPQRSAPAILENIATRDTNRDMRLLLSQARHVERCVNEDCW
jgi:hypothetical protein